MSIEGTANTEYASLSGKIRTFVIDKSLTISGACADAKATGEAIEKNAGAAAEEYLSKALPPAVDAAVSDLNARFDVLDGQYKLEKILDFTLPEDTLKGFYLELQKPLTNYPWLFFKSQGARISAAAVDMKIVAVESTESENALYELFEFGGSAASYTGHETAEMSWPKSTWTDTKYLYVRANATSATIYAGLHLEIWGAVK